MCFVPFQLWSLRMFSLWPVEGTTLSSAQVWWFWIILQMNFEYVGKFENWGFCFLICFSVQLREKCLPLAGTVRVSWGSVTVMSGRPSRESRSLIHRDQSECSLPVRTPLLLSQVTFRCNNKCQLVFFIFSSFSLSALMAAFQQIRLEIQILYELCQQKFNYKYNFSFEYAAQIKSQMNKLTTFQYENEFTKVNCVTCSIFSNLKSLFNWTWSLWHILYVLSILKYKAEQTQASNVFISCPSQKVGNCSCGATTQRVRLVWERRAMPPRHTKSAWDNQSAGFPVDTTTLP